MVTIGSLWPAILLSAVLVWVASFIVWVVLPHHKRDYKGLPDEKAAREGLGALDPGQYNIPHLESRSDLKRPEVVKLFADGPVGFLTVLPRGVPAMGKSMALSFIYYLAVGFIVRHRVVGGLRTRGRTRCHLVRPALVCRLEDAVRRPDLWAAHGGGIRRLLATVVKVSVCPR